MSEIRAAISNAYYEARNAGQTMEQAADDATAAVEALVAAAWDEGHRAGCAYFPDCVENGHHDANPYGSPS